MLVVMTINAEILPVAPVGRVVVVIVILVMDREHVEIFVGEVPAAAGAYPGMDLQRLFAVALQALFSDLTGLLCELGELLAAWCGAGFFRRFRFHDSLPEKRRFWENLRKRAPNGFSKGLPHSQNCPDGALNRIPPMSPIDMTIINPYPRVNSVFTELIALWGREGMVPGAGIEPARHQMPRDFKFRTAD